MAADKIQGQVAEQGLLLFERKVTQCLRRLGAHRKSAAEPQRHSNGPAKPRPEASQQLVNSSELGTPFRLKEPVPLGY